MLSEPFDPAKKRGTGGKVWRSFSKVKQALLKHTFEGHEVQ